MDAAHEERIRLEVARRLTSASTSLPVSVLGRASRTVLGMARAGTLSLERTLRKGRGGRDADVDAVSAVVASIGGLKGVTMKLGQVLGYIDFGIPDDLKAGLSVLHTRAQPQPFEWIRAVVDQELGQTGRELSAGMEREPFSAASIGQVHRGKLPGGEAVAVKVAYPGIEEAVKHDFGPAALSSRLASWVYPGSHLDTFVQEVRTRVLEECDYALEARRQARFGQLYAWHPTLAVPAVFERYCSAHVLTTRWVDGLHLEAFLKSRPPQEARSRAGEALFDFYLGTLFKHGLYHCDPHPGNYLFTPDGVSFLDFGCVREFEPGFVERLARLSRAVGADDKRAIEDALQALGATNPSEPVDFEAARWLLRAFYGPMLKDEACAFDLAPGLALKDLLKRGKGIRGLGLPGELLFLLRTWLGLSAVLARLEAKANWYQLLHGALAAHDARVAARAAGAPDTSAPARAAPSARGFAAGQSYDGPCDVVLLDPGAAVIEVVRQLRDLTGLPLRDVKDAIDRRPWSLKQGLPFAQAQALKERLEAAGAQVEVRPSP